MPLTPAAVFNSYFGLRNSDTYAANANPGKRTGGFDFSYRLPLMRDWVTLYGTLFRPMTFPPSRRRAAPALILASTWFVFQKFRDWICVWKL